MKIKLLSLLFLTAIMLSFGTLVYAQQAPSNTSGSIDIPNPLKVNSISALIDRLLTYVITIATILLPLAIIYAAYLFMTSGGDPEKVTEGRKTILYAVLGYALILISKGVAMIVAEILGGR